MRRKAPRVVWIPGTPEFSVDAAGINSWSSAVTASINDNIAGDSVTVERPLVLDGSGSEPLSTISTLADIEGSGYRLRRIVGKIFVFLAQSNDVGATLIGVTAGIIIRRTDSAGNSLAQIGGDINPAKVENTMDPWIWRRSWCMQNGPTFAGASAAPTQESDNSIARLGPADNYSWGPSALDGPHVDQKTARIVGPEERLFLDVSGTVLQADSLALGNTALVVFYEFRVLGSMRSSSGNRRNASR